MEIIRGKDQPEVLVKWYDYTKWALDRVDGFPKGKRFVLGTRLADAVVKVLELLGEAVYSERVRKRELLEEANRKIEVVRWFGAAEYGSQSGQQPAVPVQREGAGGMRADGRRLGEIAGIDKRC